MRSFRLGCVLLFAELLRDATSATDGASRCATAQHANPSEVCDDRHFILFNTKQAWSSKEEQARRRLVLLPCVYYRYNLSSSFLLALFLKLTGSCCGLFGGRRPLLWWTFSARELGKPSFGRAGEQRRGGNAFAHAETDGYARQWLRGLSSLLE